MSENEFPCVTVLFVCFFFNDTATTEIYTLSLHDALPIYWHEFPAQFAGISLPVLSVPGLSTLERNSPSAAFHLRHGSSVGNFCQLSRSNPPDAYPCPKCTEPFYEQDVEVLFLSGGIVGHRRRAPPPIPRQCPGVARRSALGHLLRRHAAPHDSFPRPAPWHGPAFRGSPGSRGRRPGTRPAACRRHPGRGFLA